LNEDPDHEIKSKLLKLKWGHLMLKERLKVLERDPVNQKKPTLSEVPVGPFILIGLQRLSRRSDPFEGHIDRRRLFGISGTV
jgi:hypothetical protein